ASLLAFIIVYFTVFGIGVWYILKLMGKPPQAGEYGVKRGDVGPIRTAGITPGPTQNPGGAETLPTEAPADREPV
ncbi:MAG: cytochrome ubiquinol oxidase subunit I, partial [Erythrobacter sp.]|nr:cytochrome ubiquinol oxidase subunit I [Erythrobacter sp.]